MRYINLDNLKLPDGWQGRAVAAIANGHEKINNHSDVWRDLKPPLMELSNDKCYYCEILQERSDGVVDHFRPKSKYPWSAFSPPNYRFAYTFYTSVRTDNESGNTGGKGIRFLSTRGRSGQPVLKRRQMKVQFCWIRVNQMNPAL